MHYVACRGSMRRKTTSLTVLPVYDTAPDESGQNVCVPATSGCILERTQFVVLPFLGTINCLNNFTMEPISFLILSMQEIAIE